LTVIPTASLCEPTLTLAKRVAFMKFIVRRVFVVASKI